jgi:hypothetical protein
MTGPISWISVDVKPGASFTWTTSAAFAVLNNTDNRKAHVIFAMLAAGVVVVVILLDDQVEEDVDGAEEA